MKTIALILILLAPLVQAQKMRKWTQASSGKTLTARLVDKENDNSRVKLAKRTGKPFWIDTDQLSEADQKFVKAWVRRVTHLKVRTAGTRGNGRKNLVIEMDAGSRPMKVVVDYHTVTRRKDIFILKVGEKITRNVTTSHNKYDVTAYAGEVNERGRVTYTEQIATKSNTQKIGLGQ